MPAERAAGGRETAVPFTRGSVENNNSSFGWKHSDLGFLFSFLAGGKAVSAKTAGNKMSA